MSSNILMKYYTRHGTIERERSFGRVRIATRCLLADLSLVFNQTEVKEKTKVKITIL